MDYVLRAEDQNYVSDLLSIRVFKEIAAGAKEKVEKTKSAVNILEQWIGPRSTKAVLDSIDLTRYRKRATLKLDRELNTSELYSQTLLKKENMRRVNPQYKSIAIRACSYDKHDLSTIARESPYQPDFVRDERWILGVATEFWQTVVSEQNKKEKRSKPVPSSSKIVSNRLTEYKPNVSKSEEPGHEVVLSISIFVGYSKDLEYHEKRLGRLMKVTDKVEMCGSHTLLDLKNLIFCPSDVVFNGDFSFVSPKKEHLSQSRFPSSFLFINDTFYIDDVTPNAIDLSKQFREFALGRPEIGPLKTASMSVTKLEDLVLRLGQPYVYVHQGNCEHLITFTDVCLMTRLHRQFTFPRRIYEKTFKRIPCFACKVSSANWVVTGHSELPTSETFACNSCYRDFFFKDGKKVGNFLSKPYCDRRVVNNHEDYLDLLNKKPDNEKVRHRKFHKVKP